MTCEIDFGLGIGFTHLKYNYFIIEEIQERKRNVICICKAFIGRIYVWVYNTLIYKVT